MIGWLCVAFGTALGTAVAPVISIEVFVVGLASALPDMHWLLLGAVVAAGQVGGKLFYYLGARGSIRLPAPLYKRLHRERVREPSPRRERWQLRTKRFRRWLETVRERCHRHPFWMNSTYAVSSLVGLPPFMATTVLAGIVRMRIGVFLTTGLVGRCIRFSLLAAAPTLVTTWLPG